MHIQLGCKVGGQWPIKKRGPTSCMSPKMGPSGTIMHWLVTINVSKQSAKTLHINRGRGGKNKAFLCITSLFSISKQKEKKQYHPIQLLETGMQLA